VAVVEFAAPVSERRNFPPSALFDQGGTIHNFTPEGLGVVPR
jgi:hypothetical protein